MKKRFFIAGAAILLATVAVTGIAAYGKAGGSELLDANIEALTRYEIDPVEIICSDIGCHYCYSEHMDGIRFWCEWEGTSIWYCRFCD